MKKTSRNGKWNSSLYHTQQLKALFTTSPVPGSLEGQDQKGERTVLGHAKEAMNCSSEQPTAVLCWKLVLETFVPYAESKKNCQPQSNLIWTDWNIFFTKPEENEQWPESTLEDRTFVSVLSSIVDRIWNMQTLFYILLNISVKYHQNRSISGWLKKIKLINSNVSPLKYVLFIKVSNSAKYFPYSIIFRGGPVNSNF